MIKANKIITPGQVLTPEEENLTYVFAAGRKEPVYVAEIPHVRFRELPLCLATHKRSEVAKVHHCKYEIARILGELTGIKP